MSDINQKTRIPLGWAVTIIVTVISVAFNAGIAHFRLQNLQKQWQEYKVSRVDSQRGFREQQLKLQRLDLTLDNISKRLESIDRKLDRMEKR